MYCNAHACWCWIVILVALTCWWWYGCSSYHICCGNRWWIWNENFTVITADNESKRIHVQIAYLVVIQNFIEIILIIRCFVMTRKASLIIHGVTMEIIRARAGKPARSLLFFWMKIFWPNWLHFSVAEHGWKRNFIWLHQKF